MENLNYRCIMETLLFACACFYNTNTGLTAWGVERKNNSKQNGIGNSFDGLFGKNYDMNIKHLL